MTGAWRQLSALFEAAGGLIGIALLGLCVAGVLFLADRFIGEDDSKAKDRQGPDA